MKKMKIKQEKECQLCKIQEEIYRIVEENNEAIATVVKEPLKEGHIMVLPRRHVKKLSELNEKELKSTVKLIDNIKLKLEKMYKDPPAVHINSGKNSTQEHLHIHVFPSRGGLRELVSNFERVPLRQDVSKEEKERIANKIKDFIIS